jgi:predicted Zn finger-like uncharacterized protein
MIITCEECKTSYNLDANQLQPSGTKVRCTNCQHVFTAYPPPDEAPATVKAEPVADTQTDTPPPQPTDDLDMFDSDDLFDIDEQETASTPGAGDSEGFDLSDEDFDLPGNDMELPEVEALSEADLQLTDDDLDLVMDMAPVETQTAPVDESAPALEAPSAEEAPEPEPAAGLGDDLDLNLDFDLEEGDDATAPESPNLEGTDELDLDLDLDLDLGEDDAVDTGGAAEATSLSLDEDLQPEADALTEEGLSPDDDFGTETPQEPVGEGKPADDDLAFEDLDLELDLAGEEDTPGEDGGEPELALEIEDDAAEAADDALDLDLDFDLETEAEAPADASEAPSPAGVPETEESLLELDLGDEEDKPADLTGDEDFSLDLDNLELMGDDEVHDEVRDADKPEDELELDLGDDLSLAMDDDQEVASGGAEDDLDLADLEGILEENDSDPNKAAASTGDGALEEESLFGDDDLGLANELESILDEEDDAPDATFSLEEEPELDLDLESPATASRDDDSLDLSDFEYLAEEGETAPSDDHFDSGDMELEFQVDEEGDSALEEADAEFTPPVETEEKPAEPEIVPEAPAAATGPAGPAPVPPKKRGISKLLIAVLIVVLLLGGGYCAYVLLDGMGIRIPYLSDYLKPEANDPGNLQLTTFDINSRFVDSQVLGRIFVITGKVKNGYDHPRGFVQLTGKLFTKGKVLASSQPVYAGNLISDMDLVNLNADELKKRLNNRFGNKRMNSRVQPGKSLPFMVVFSALPEAQLEEFTIEVDASTALK